ncbi:chemotaxis protein CheA [Desulfonema magnum]|uniref:Chemotaxis protein CheA n=1 Tax=Desulfonema magnum TaxID=45655 RepID=A0A975BM66_9BACT|nr:chemotaxis protein CheA [Desulfonema magnum]QTA88066.1 Two component system histidine kinase, Hpt-family [Desulfonema magnum]
MTTENYTEYYRKQFYQEAREIIEKVNDDILQAEAAPDNQELLHAIFRGIHTIKGSAGSFDLEDISEFTHHLEGLLSLLRDGKISLTPELADVILAGTDHIFKMIEDHAAGREATIDQNLTKRFQSFLTASQQTELSGETPYEISSPKKIDIPLPSEVQDAFQEAAAIGLYVFRVRLKYSSELLENGYDPLVFLQNLRQSCTFYHAVINASVPLIEEFSPLTLYLYPTVYVATALSAEDIKELTFDPDLILVEAVHVRLDEVHAEPLHEFVDSAVEILESLEKAVIDYETSGSRESLNEIFRMVHNLKGDAGLIGLEEINVFAHALESLLERLRSGTIHRTFALVDVILQSVDFLRQSVLKLEQGIKIPDFPPVFETLKYYASMKDDLERKQSLLKDVSPELRDVFTEQARQYKDILLGHTIRPDIGDAEKTETVKIVTRALRGLAKASEFVGLKTLQVQAQKALSASDREDDQMLAEAVEKITAFIDGLEGEPEDQTAPRVSREEESLSKKEPGMEIRSLRIDERKVDHFTNMVGELLIARNTYDHLVGQLEDAEKTGSRGADPAVRKTVKALKENLHLFSRLTNDIHHGVMSLRMIPVKKIFQKFNRIIRDISRRQKKSVQLLTGGEDIEIDKKVADMLSDPLIHLVRNACDHGIEMPEIRKAAGKPERGTVIISASQEGSSIYIRIIDDGQGIDRQKLYEKAKEAGVATDLPDDPSLLDLVFIPGLSTSTQVSDISGRGVGMDVVRTTVNYLGGTVGLISNEGKGTEVVLSIPTSLGIDTVLFVEAGGISYAIPLEYIVETLKIPFEKIKSAGRHMVFHHRGEVLSVERLEKILYSNHLSSDTYQRSETTDRSSPETDDCSVVLVKTRRGKCGLIVDRLNKNTEVAIKPPPGILASIDIISGVSIMGDGKVFLVLNPENFFK